MQVNFTPEEIDKAIVEKVLESKLGAAVKAAIEKTLNDLMTKSYGASVSAAVDEEIIRIIRELLAKEYRQQIESKVREFITNDRLTEITNAAWDQLNIAIGKLRR